MIVLNLEISAAKTVNDIITEGSSSSEVLSAANFLAAGIESSNGDVFVCSEESACTTPEQEKLAQSDDTPASAPVSTLSKSAKKVKRHTEKSERVINLASWGTVALPSHHVCGLSVFVSPSNE